jgi:hypothetical protein
MKALYNNVWIAAGGLLGEPEGFTLEQVPITEAAQFFRAPAMTFFGRGNVRTTVRFRVTASFSTVREAQVYALTLRNTLPNQATLSLVCGDGGDTQQVNLQDAVLSPIEPRLTGVAVTTAYEFNGGLFDTEDIPLPDPTVTVKKFTVSLTQGTNSVAVTFDSPFGSTPSVVTCSIIAPDGGYVIACAPDQATISATGFTALFGASIPGSGYYLSGEALL